MQKHTPTEIDSKFTEQLGKKATEIMAQFPNINLLENKLDVRTDDDPELSLAQKSISSNI